MSDLRNLLLACLMLLSVAWPQNNAGERVRPKREGTIPEILPFKSRVRGTALEAPIVAADYVVGPGDVFLVSIFGVEPYVVEATVTPASKLLLLKIGSFDVSDLTAAAVSHHVLAKIKQTYPTYQADCILYGIREIVVSLSGAVANPGMYNVTPLVRLTTLIRQGGNALSNAALHRVEIHSLGGVRTVDVYKYLLEGDRDHNPLLGQGDRVIVPYSDAATEMVSVRGWNVVPTYLSMRPGETLGKLLDRWYKPGSKADLSSVELDRPGADGQSNRSDYNFTQYAAVVLKAGDIIYVSPFEDVAVVGEVRRPGHYPFAPGLTVGDYLTRAGGVTPDGSRGRVHVERDEGQAKNSSKTEVEAGDVISVPRSTRTKLVGQTGMIQVVIAVFNIYLTFLAATR